MALLLAGFAFSTVAYDCEGPAPGPPPATERALQWLPEGERLVFVAYEEGAGIYLADVADGNLRVVIQKGDDEAFPPGEPSISPDGSRVAYITEEFEAEGGVPTWDIVTSALDGSDRRRVTNSPGSESNPVWSPDGTQIAFILDGWPGSQLYVMSEDGSNVRNVAPEIWDVGNPAWSPDGNRLSFWSRRTVDEPGSVYVVSPEGEDLRKVGEAWRRPAWSPDGKRLVFARLAGPSPSYTKTLSLVTVAADGSDEQVVFSAEFRTGTKLPHYRDLFGITWSRDGAEIRFTAAQYLPVEGRSDAARRTIGLYTIKANGEDLRLLTEVDPPGHVSWSPDGSKVAVYSPMFSFAGFHTADSAEVYVMDKDGSSKHTLMRGEPRL